MILIVCAIFIMRYYFNLETEAVYIEDLRTELDTSIYYNLNFEIVVFKSIAITFNCCA